VTLINASRNALAELCGLYHQDVFLGQNDPHGPKRTITELYDALTGEGEDVSDYQVEYEMCLEDMATAKSDNDEKSVKTRPVVEYKEPRTLCKHCDHFVENDNVSDPAAAGYVHLDDGEQEYDHNAEPSETVERAELEKIRPDLWRRYADGKIGPNSWWHSRRGKIDPPHLVW